jgi:hypothetical protein
MIGADQLSALLSEFCELVGPVKFAHHVRAKLCDDAVQKFVL